MDAHVTVGLLSVGVDGQLGKGLLQRGGDPLHVGAAAVIDLHARVGQQVAVLLPQHGGLGGRDGLLGTQLVHTVALLGTHLLDEAVGGVGALIVDLRADAVNEIGLLTVHIGPGEDTLLRIGLEQHLAQQTGGGLHDVLPLQGVGIVQEAGHKAHALGLTLLAHGGLDGATVQLVQSGGQRLHIGVYPGAPAQDVGDQGIQTGLVLRQGGHQSNGQVCTFELVGVDTAQPHTGKKFLPDHIRHNGSSGKIILQFDSLSYHITDRKANTLLLSHPLTSKCSPSA